MLGFIRRSFLSLRLNALSGYHQGFRPSYSFGYSLWHDRRERIPQKGRHARSSKGHQDSPTSESSSRQFDEQNTVPKKNAEDNRDIFIHDLSATLEAHRATNRTKLIRKIHTNAPSTIREIPTGDLHSSCVHRILLTRPEPSSLDNDDRNNADIHDGVAKEPSGEWKSIPSKEREQSPWLPLVAGTAGDGFARYLHSQYCFLLALTD